MDYTILTQKNSDVLSVFQHNCKLYSYDYSFIGKFRLVCSNKKYRIEADLFLFEKYRV